MAWLTRKYSYSDLKAGGCSFPRLMKLDGMINAPIHLFRCRFEVPGSAVDRNGHVNNVVYVQWMQDVAVRHFTAMGGAEPMSGAGATWVVRSHAVEYLKPAFAGERIEARTWVENLGRVRSTRRYEFIRTSDETLLARGATEWVFVDLETGRPRAIPPEVRNLFTLSGEGPRRSGD
jgi:acyl-CoA thioester hydrolase